jgi:hypothetical protein
MLYPPGFEDDSAPAGYAGFEHIVGTLIWAASQADLQLFEASNTLEVVTLERRFSVNCAPEGWPPPVDIWAQISFAWPVENSTLSLYGDEALCDLYHNETANCRHQPLTANLVTELEVVYMMSEHLVSHLDSDEGIEKTARRIRRMFTDLVDHENIIAVEATALFTDDGLKLAGIRAGHVWMFEDELTDISMLRESLVSICQEIAAVLGHFQQAFAASGSQE